jgi:protein SCO1/2
VYFGYAFCADVCPTALNAMAAAPGKLGTEADRVQALFITVDPKRDTPLDVGRYTGAISRRLIALTGTIEQIAAVENECRVYAAEHRYGSGPNEYTMGS